MQDKLIKLWSREAILSYLKESYIKCNHKDPVIYHIPVYTQKDLFWTQRIHLQELPPTGAMTGHENYQALQLEEHQLNSCDSNCQAISALQSTTEWAGESFLLDSYSA